MEAIDLFAGGGGFTTGAKAAGARIRWAANHNPLAVEFHRRNHPEITHACQDLQQADWRAVPPHELLLASPSCTGHTRARGREQAHHDKDRNTAWAVVQCAEYHRPRLFVVENSPDFLGWCLYPSWLDAMQRLGYTVTANVLDAADCGVPQNRVRLFLVGRLHRTPITVEAGTCAHVPARSFIQLDAGVWTPVDAKCPKTRARVERGRQQLGAQFLAPYYSKGSGLTGRSLDRPIGTVPCTDRWSVVNGDVMRMLTVDEYRAACGFPADYAIPRTKQEAVRILGNAVPPALAEHVVRSVIEQC